MPSNSSLGRKPQALCCRLLRRLETYSIEERTFEAKPYGCVVLRKLTLSYAPTRYREVVLTASKLWFLKPTQRRQHFLAVARWSNLFKYLCDVSFWINDKRVSCGILRSVVLHDRAILRRNF